MIDRVARPFAWLLLALATAMTVWDLVATTYGRDVSFLGFAAVDALWEIGFFAFSVVGTLIVTRIKQQPVGWLLVWIGALMSLELLLARLGENAIYVDRRAFDPRLAWLTNWVWVPPLTFLTVQLPLYFPDGRLPSARWRAIGWLGAFAIVVSTATAAFRAGSLDYPFDGVVNPFGTPPFDPTLQTMAQLVWFGSAIGACLALAARFRRADSAQRQQIKWLLASLVPGLGFVITSVLWAQTGNAAGQLASYALILVPVWTTAVATACALAIFRYRLYDIDLVINRALVYGATTALIAIAFVAGIVVLQALLRPLTSGSEIAVAASTLGSVALVQPIRRRIQGAVDRRFYRARYDAVRTLDDFSVRLRDQVAIDAVRSDLLDAVRQTVQPAHASVWLRE